jgi:hypothetical protein
VTSIEPNNKRMRANPAPARMIILFFFFFFLVSLGLFFMSSPSPYGTILPVLVKVSPGGREPQDLFIRSTRTLV